MTLNAEIVSTFFTKSIIRSRAAMTYEEAQLMIDDRWKKESLIENSFFLLYSYNLFFNNSRKNDEVSRALRSLNQLAKVLKKKRLANGALTLASPQVKFIKD